MVEYIYIVYIVQYTLIENTLDKVENIELGESEIQTTYPKLKCSTIWRKRYEVK